MLTCKLAIILNYFGSPIFVNDAVKKKYLFFVSLIRLILCILEAKSKYSSDVRLCQHDHDSILPHLFLLKLNT